MKKTILSASLLVFLFIAAIPLTAQNDDVDSGPVNPELEILLDSALSSAELGNWDQAISTLDEAEKIDPADPRILSYRTSILELAALDAAQNSWSDGDPSEVKVVDSQSDTENIEEDDTPKFVIDRGDKGSENDPASYRDNLRADLSIEIFAVNPATSETVNTWSTGNELFYASLGTDMRYWMPFLGKSIGFNFRSSGYSWAPGSPDVLFNSLDLGINLRGFLLESKLSRMELGLDFGVSFQSTNNLGSEVLHDGALFLGFWISDPILFHIFKAESVENLVFGGGIRIYSSTTADLTESINYRVEGHWNFRRAYTGVRLEWWDFTADSTSLTMLSFSLFGGFRY